MAAELLFLLARRQANDFLCSTRILKQWEQLDEAKRQWLWSENAVFWEYLGLVFFAYQSARHDQKAEALAQTYLSDPATPTEGLVQLGIPYARWLIAGQNRTDEGLNLFRRLVLLAPTHPLCANAYYWLSLDARRRGDMEASKAFAARIRTAQRTQAGTIVARRLVALGRLLEHDLDLSHACPTALEREEYEDALEWLLVDLRKLDA